VRELRLALPWTALLECTCSLEVHEVLEAQKHATSFRDDAQTREVRGFHSTKRVLDMAATDAAAYYALDVLLTL